MICEMASDYLEELDIEVPPSMWPEDLRSEAGKQFNIEKPGLNHDMLDEITIVEEPSIVDFKRLLELTNYSENGSSQLAYLVKQWEQKQANAVRLLHEELNTLSKQRQEVERKKLEIIEAHQFEEDKHAGDKRSISILDEVFDIWETLPRRKKDIILSKKKLEIDAEYDTVKYWKQRAMELDKLLEASNQREQILQGKLQEVKNNMERQASPVEELSQILKRADNFLHFILQNAPVVIGHQDKELRYRFIYNHFPSLHEEDIIGRTDVEIFSGAGVKESQDFKKEVMERGLPAKREITFQTDLFGSKTFLIHVEPVFSKSGETIGVNYLGMDVTNQVIKREKMAKLREEIAVQKAKETELNKTIHITEETMRAKQMLATMSHEIRSPLTGVVSMAEILANTKLDREQRQLLDVMLSSGDLVLQLINDILDLSKVESGVMKLEATKFRPREVVRHVLQTAAASLQKDLILEGLVSDDVPVEVIGDVLRIRQVLTNLISNAIKFTHEGKVGINLRVVPDHSRQGDGRQSPVSVEPRKECSFSASESSCYSEPTHVKMYRENNEIYGATNNGPEASKNREYLLDEEREKHHLPQEMIVWLCCDVYDTGIGIPEEALPSLFKRYMQVSADHARKYGGTGLGLAICKQLAKLMGGHLSVTSQENYGSTFTFLLPCKVSLKGDHSDDCDGLPDMANCDTLSDCSIEENYVGQFQFRPHAIGSALSPAKCMTRANNLSSNHVYNTCKLNVLPESFSCPNNFVSKEPSFLEDGHSITNNADNLELERSSKLDLDFEADDLSQRDENHTAAGNGLLMSRYNGPNMDSKTIQGYKNSLQGTTISEKPSEGKITNPVPGHDDITKPGSSLESMENSSQPKILLVEDNKINVMVTQSMMKQLGHKIDVVNNGLEAVLAVQSNIYDLILMDVCMPVMDGLQATRLIRSYEENGNWDAAVAAGITLPAITSQLPPDGPVLLPVIKRMPIIAMTANALAESAAECLAIGMDSFVSKPVTFRKLRHSLQQYLSSSNM